MSNDKLTKEINSFKPFLILFFNLKCETSLRLKNEI